MKARQSAKIFHSPVALHDIGYEQAIAKLPSSIRWVAILAFVEGLSPWEIASLASVDVGVVIDALNRGQSLAQDIHQRLISDNTGGVCGNH